MGKRSRQRAARGSTDQAPAGRRRRRSAAERRVRQRPAAPWDPFPLTELAVLSGLILLVIGIVIGGSTGRGLIAAGVLLACIGGLETVLREHLAGFRSHSGLLAGIASLAVLIASTAIFDISVPVRAALAIGTFALVFPALRSAFIRKSGGRGVL